MISRCGGGGALCTTTTSGCIVGVEVTPCAVAGTLLTIAEAEASCQ